MKTFFQYTFAFLVIAALSVGAYRFLPATLGKVPPAGHGHSDEHAHGDPSATMSDAKVAAAGIELDKAGPATLARHAAPQRHDAAEPGSAGAGDAALSRHHARDAQAGRRHGCERGRAGAIESNQSLTAYELKAPIGGTVIDRQRSLGEYASEQKPAFIIADLSNVWVDFAVHRRDLKRVKAGDTVMIDPEDGGDRSRRRFPMSLRSAPATPRARWRAPWSRTDGRLRPGLFVTGRVVLAAKPFHSRSSSAALQTVEGRTVVFVRNGEKFEAREVELGERDAERAEIAVRPVGRRRLCRQEQLRHQGRDRQGLRRARALGTAIDDRRHPRLFHPASAGWCMIAVAGHGRARRLEFHAPADRRRARHHQRPGADQHQRAGLFAARSRAAHHLPDRNRDGRPAAACNTRARCRATA